MHKPLQGLLLYCFQDPQWLIFQKKKTTTTTILQISFLSSDKIIKCLFLNNIEYNECQNRIAYKIIEQSLQLQSDLHGQCISEWKDLHKQHDLQDNQQTNVPKLLHLL